MWTAILGIISTALKWVTGESDLRNRPDMVKNKGDIARQAEVDKVRAAEAVLANPGSSQRARAAALKIIREAAS